MSVAESDHERKLIRYTAFKASGMSITAARKCFGMHNVAANCLDIEKALKKARDVYDAANKLL